jgi:sialate O-acetylesterase
MVVSLDLAADEKGTRELARRLGLWARSEIYGEDLVASGPVYESMKIEIDKIRVKFKSVGGGLAVSGDELKGFTISGEFQRFVPAKARIEGDTVVLWSEQVKWPAAARYGWADWPDGTLVNREGLPASPFRTDAWPKR